MDKSWGLSATLHMAATPRTVRYSPRCAAGYCFHPAAAEQLSLIEQKIKRSHLK